MKLVVKLLFTTPSGDEISIYLPIKLTFGRVYIFYSNATEVIARVVIEVNRCSLANIIVICTFV